MNMRLFQIFSSFYLFIIPIFAQRDSVPSSGLIPRLNELGLDGFARMLVANNPDLVQRISHSQDVTVWAPGNAKVAAWLAANRKRDSNSAGGPSQTTKTRPEPQDAKYPSDRKRQAGEGPPGYPDSNFETVYTFLNDSQYVNLGPDQVLRYVKNYGAPPDGGATSASPQELTSGLGAVHSTLRGPYKFRNGVIYEVNDFNTLPQPFTQTFRHLKLGEKFYKKVVHTGNLPLFEETPAVTIFAPIDSHVKTHHSPYNSDPRSHIILGKLGFSPELLPGRTIYTASGAPIVISFAKNGERLVNCRRLVKANVITKNGVVHFIDGPLFGGCDGSSKHNY